ncbi:MAG: hypothetical protein GWO08_01955 [Gammaproteobacteria bacterium]|nr:hypothetical protein [Gammaproteobacteria bacterium]NIW96978.1 hypothetical protein [Phycisphaerae bacterium]
MSDLAITSPVVLPGMGLKWKTKPPAGTSLNKQHPLYPYLIFATALNGPQGSTSSDSIGMPGARDLVKNRVPVSANAASKTLGIRFSSLHEHAHLRGVGYFCDGTIDENNDHGLVYPGLYEFSGAEVTMITASTFSDALDSAGSRSLSYVNGGGGESYGLQASSDGVIRWRAFGSEVDATVDAAGFLDDCIEQAGRKKVGENRVWARRKSTGTLVTNSTSGSVTSFEGDEAMCIGCNVDWDRSMIGEVYYGFVFTADLSQQWIESIWDNPWQLYEPSPIYLAPPDPKRRVVLW